VIFHLFYLVAIYGMFFLFIGVISWVEWGLLFFRLQKKHPDLWKRLGEPPVFLRPGLIQVFRVIRFYRSEKYRTLTDASLKRSFKVVAWSQLTLFALVVIAILTWIISALR